MLEAPDEEAPDLRHSQIDRLPGQGFPFVLCQQFHQGNPLIFRIRISAGRQFQKHIVPEVQKILMFDGFHVRFRIEVFQEGIKCRFRKPTH